MRRAFLVTVVLLAAALPALAASRMSLTTYFAVAFKDEAWQKTVSKRVATSFRIPAEASIPKPGKKSVVIATVNRAGKVVATLPNLSSGSKAWDAEADRAVRSSSPFPALPASFDGTQLEVHFHFFSK